MGHREGKEGQRLNLEGQIWKHRIEGNSEHQNIREGGSLEFPWEKLGFACLHCYHEKLSSNGLLFQSVLKSLDSGRINSVIRFELSP